MNTKIALLVAALAAGCSPDAAQVTAPVRPSSTASAAQVEPGVEESVTGHAEHTFLLPGGAQLDRNVSFSARRLPTGEAQGRFHVTLNGPAAYTGGERDGTRSVTFDVVCLEVEGDRAWIGGQIVAPRTDPYYGFQDVWVVIDGGETGPDRVAEFIGRSAERCRERPNVTGRPSQRGELVVRDDG